MGDSQRFALENSPHIAKTIAIHQNFRRYCKKAILYPICSKHPMLSISMAYNVISCKKNGRNTKKIKSTISSYLGESISDGNRFAVVQSFFVVFAIFSETISFADYVEYYLFPLKSNQ